MAKLKVDNLDGSLWGQAGISLPQFNIAQIRENTRRRPEWIHFGGGNIFRGYIAGLQQELLDRGCADTGIIVAENYDPEIITDIYAPYDNLALTVRMSASGEMDKKVTASVAEALISCSSEADWQRIREIFTSSTLQLCSFTITEKGYALRKMDGQFQDTIAADIMDGPQRPVHLMAQITSLLYERFKAGGFPMAMVSMDNCSCNGKLLHDAILEIAIEWQKRGFVSEEFIQYLSNDNKVSFPWSMIDKITPRPSATIQKLLEGCGVEDMAIVCTERGTYMAPFVNTEKAEYLVIEDDFPAGRPELEASGVIFTDRDTVQKTERMKVMTCLNPLHTALAILGCLLDFRTIADEMDDQDLRRLVEGIGYREGMPVVTDPGIIDPKAFLAEVLTERFPNPNIPDTPQRIATDTSQKMPVRFGETLKAYMCREDLDIGSLVLIPLVIAAWVRYLLAVDDNGRVMELSSDPLMDELHRYTAGIEFGRPETVGNNLRPLLQKRSLFGVDLYEAGLGIKIEEIFKEMIKGPGSVRQTLRDYL